MVRSCREKSGRGTGASNSLMTNTSGASRHASASPGRPDSKLTVRAGYGIYYDRGEFFSYLSPSAGSGFNGPFGVTLAPPFVEPVAAARGASISTPFGTTVPTPPTVSAANFLAYLPNLSADLVGLLADGQHVWPVPLWRL